MLLRGSFIIWYSLRPTLCCSAPHETDAGARGEGPVADMAPAAIGIPVHVTGIDTAVGVYLLYKRYVSQPASSLHSWLEHEDSVQMGLRGDIPSELPGARGPCIRIATPGNVKSGYLVITIVGPIGALTVGETVTIRVTRRARIVAILPGHGGSRGSLLRDQVRVTSTYLYQVTDGLNRVKEMVTLVINRHNSQQGSDGY